MDHKTLVSRIGMYLHDHGFAIEVAHIETIVAMCTPEPCTYPACQDLPSGALHQCSKGVFGRYVTHEEVII